MKIFLVLYQGNDWNKNVPEWKERFKNSYCFWGEYCKKLNILLCRASIDWFKDGCFEKYWQYKDGMWIKVLKKLKPDVVYDKARIFDDNGYDFDIYEKLLLIASKYRFINLPQASLFLDDKINQSLIFKDYMPLTYFLKTGDTFDNPKEKKWVVKYAFGSGGKNIMIVDQKRIEAKKDVIIQEFIDGKVDNRIRDYRLVYLGSELVYGVSRVAKKDSFFTNTHMGAKVEFIDLNQKKYINLLDKARLASECLKLFPKLVYSLDFFISDNKVYLIEMNTTPGVGVLDSNTKVRELFFRKLTDLLLK
jgi:glutathione synthase/RimK-type ligase-like ATP-grasp enzyme